ncbi:S-adenosyl-l-methionine hydroxide adenosyltransferase family protein [soil metagenome]
MIIALLTDFGTRDYFVGAMKGAILSINKEAQIIDITHEIPPQDIQSASFTLRACYRDFPKKTIFTAVVDPGVGSDRRAILVETENYYFISPDNGLLSFIFNENEFVRVFELANDTYFNHPVSNTFHGRDIFAPAAAHLSNGVKPNKFGNELQDFVSFEEQKPRKISDDKIEAEIIHTDRFGNLISNLKKEDLFDDFTVLINGKRISKIQQFFAESSKSELFMIFGSAGFLEIAAFQDSAAKLLKVKFPQKILLEKN